MRGVQVTRQNGSSWTSFIALYCPSYEYLVSAIPNLWSYFKSYSYAYRTHSYSGGSQLISVSEEHGSWLQRLARQVRHILTHSWRWILTAHNRQRRNTIHRSFIRLPWLRSRYQCAVRIGRRTRFQLARPAYRSNVSNQHSSPEPLLSDFLSR